MESKNDVTSHSFGTQEMSALMGTIPTASSLPGTSSTMTATAAATNVSLKEVDVSALDAAQTAHLLRTQQKAQLQQQQSQQHKQQRHRGTKVRQYHLLAGMLNNDDTHGPTDSVLNPEEDEEAESSSFVRPKRRPKLPSKPPPSLPNKPRHDTSSSSSSDSDSDDSREQDRRRPSRQRRRASSSSVSSSRSGEDRNRRRRRPSPSRRSRSSSNSSNHQQHQQQQRRRRRHDSDSRSRSSSSEDEVDARRQRIREKAKQQQQQSNSKSTGLEVEPLQPQPLLDQAVSDVAAEKSPTVVRHTKMKQRPLTSSSSSSSSDSDGSDDDSESSEEEDAPVLTTVAKPVFVPRHKRGIVAEQERNIQDEEEKEKKRVQELEQRKMQSRAMVAQAVSEAAASVMTTSEDVLGATVGSGDGPEFDERTSGMTIIPQDTDDLTPEQLLERRDAWQVRELLRLLRDEDDVEDKERERLELERRRTMPEDERLREDQALGKYRKPGEQRNPQNNNNTTYMQRYYHKGAFYMDDDTLKDAGEEDVRHRATEYARAATGEDKIDKRALPKVMQVKKFGLAGYGTKYKGLAKEDTTDKRLQYMSIIDKKNARKKPKY